MQRVNICRDVMMERKQAAANYWSIVSAICATVNGDGNCTLSTENEQAVVERLCEAARAIEHAYDPVELIVAWQPPAPPLDYSKIKPKPATPAPIIDGDLEPNWSELDTSHDDPLIVINRVNLDPFAPLDDIKLSPLVGEHPDIK